MSEFRDQLDREAKRISPAEDAIDRVRRRADGLRRRRRVAAGVVGLAIAGASIGLAYAAFRPGSEARPAGVDATPTSDDATPPPIRIELIDGTSTPGLWRYTAMRVEDLGYGRHHGGYTVANEPTVGAEAERTTLYCPPQFDHEARRLQRLFFPDSEIRGTLPDDEVAIRVVIGEDFAVAHEEGVAALDLIDAFMRARVDGQGAESFLSPSAQRDFNIEGGELSLYRYARGGAYSLGADEGRAPIIEPYGEDPNTFLVGVWNTADRRFYETLGVGTGPEGDLKIVRAHLGAITSAG